MALLAGVAAVAYLIGRDEHSGVVAGEPARPVLGGGAAPSIANAAPSKPETSTGSALHSRAGVAASPAALPPLDAPLVTYFDDLKARALSGEPRAACRIAYEIIQCTEAIDLAKRRIILFNRKLDRANPNYSSAEAEVLTTKLMPRARSQLEALEKKCQGAPASIDEIPAWQYVITAAQGGNVMAMTRFVLGLDIGLTPDRPARSPEAWIQYRQYAPQFLDSALAASDSFAFVLAARAYSDPNAMHGLGAYPLDPVRAITYYAAAAARSTPGSARTFNSSIDSIAQSRRLSPDVVTRARAEGAALAAVPAKHPPKEPLDVSESWADQSLQPYRCEQ